MIKTLIDMHFASHYGLDRVVTIDEVHTTRSHFDLSENGGASVVDYGSGYASFGNEDGCDIAVLDYEGYIDKYAGTVFHNGMGKCDCILESDAGMTVILDEITSSASGMENLQKPIHGRKDYEGGKFEKVEHQLLVSLQTLGGVPEIAAHFEKQTKKVCLCSYKLYTSEEMALIGNPVSVFGLGQAEAERQTGENGVKISSPQIETMGFEYRRISHSYIYSI